MRTLSLLCVPLVAAFAAAGELTMDLCFDSGQLEIDQVGVYTRVVAPGMSLIEHEGWPRLPLMRAKVALPTGCRATGIEVLDSNYESLTGCFDILPAGPLVPFSVQQEVHPVAPAARIYGSDEYFPHELCRLASSGAIWGIPLAYLDVSAVRWNPVSRQLEVLSDMTLRLTYEYDPSLVLISRRLESSEQAAQSMVRGMVVNPEGVSASGAQLVDARDLAYGQYVIITHPDYQSAAQDLADWKTAKGVPTNVYTTDWVASQYSCYDLPQEMRAFLTDCRDEGADYVLIYGDDDRVVARDAYMHAYSYTANAPADIYFADINDTAPGADRWDSNGNHVWGETSDDVDWHPDLWVGRASVNSVSEANLFVDKVLIYEQVASADYFETAPIEMRVGYSTGILWSSPYYPGSAAAEIISGYVPGGGWEEEKCYESTGNNSSAITIAMINAGPHHVFHASHGSQTYMYTSYGSNYTVANIMAQTNISSGNLPALWNSIACMIGQIDGYECCGDAWLASPNGGGFGSFNSRYGWGHYGEAGYGPSERICERFYYEHWSAGTIQLGPAHLVSMDHFCPPSAHGDSFEVDVLDWCIKEYNLLGDPELPMWTLEMIPMTVIHPGYIGGATTVDVNVSDPSDGPVENARVCLQKGDWQTGDIYEIGYTDASGHVGIYVNPGSAGTMDVTVWAHNHETYLGTIDVGVGIGDQGEQVAFYSLDPVTPSPARTHAVMGFSLARPGIARVDVFDLSGRLITTLTSEYLGVGAHSLTWDLTADDTPVPSGLYHVRLCSGSFQSSRSVMVLR
ncbi:hypothetical protein JW921_00975 [Candidatus Fermentibacterales bacterium]|nr:hypothetical protein [Candidatus Fermentibacterales bacterium]